MGIVLSRDGFLFIEYTKASRAIYATCCVFFMVSAIKLCPVRFRARGCTGGRQGYVGYRAASNQKRDAIRAEDPTSVAPLIAEKYRSENCYGSRVLLLTAAAPDTRIIRFNFFAMFPARDTRPPRVWLRRRQQERSRERRPFRRESYMYYGRLHVSGIINFVLIQPKLTYRYILGFYPRESRRGCVSQIFLIFLGAVSLR